MNSKVFAIADGEIVEGEFLRLDNSLYGGTFVVNCGGGTTAFVKVVSTSRDRLERLVSPSTEPDSRPRCIRFKVFQSGSHLDNVLLSTFLETHGVLEVTSLNTSGLLLVKYLADA